MKTLDIMGRRFEALKIADDLYDRILEGEMTYFLAPMRKLLQGIVANPSREREWTTAPPTLPSNVVVWTREAIWPEADDNVRSPHGSPSTDLAFLRSTLDVNTDRRRNPLTDMVYLLIRAVELNHGRRYEEARGHLIQALRIARRGSFVRSVLDADPAVVELLQDHDSLEDVADYAAMLLAEAGRYPLARALAEQDGREPLHVDYFDDSLRINRQKLEALTNREYDVLIGLQRRLSNKEIADELSISHVTVKSHTRRLYTKLDVNNRRQAISRAIALGIISDRN